ncbi:MAG: ABC transporter substrate-binding protein [Novosphingobium sp.]|nr:MAG: ABC transporter substrate-binding protein [Novosphingobium sp.]
MPTFTRRSRPVTALFLGLTLLGGCGKEQPAGRAKLVLGDQVGLSKAKIEAAKALDGAPFDYEWALFPGAAPLFEALMAGAVDTAPAGDTPVIAAAAAGTPFKIVAATRSSGRGVAILVPPGSPIRSVADLRGKQVIVSSARGSVAQYLLLGALREAKVDPREVKIGFMLPGEATAAFTAGRIDAWATFGTYQATAETRGARVLRDGCGINASLAFIAVTNAALEDPVKRRAIVDYIRRQRAANAWSIAHPAEYAEVFQRVTRVTPEVARAVVARENPQLVAPSPEIMRELQHVADRFHAEGVLPAHVDVSSIVDTSIFEEAAKDRSAPRAE